MTYPAGFISYILFDEDTRELLGGYLQVPPVEHQHRVEVSDQIRVDWPLYLLSEDMKSVYKNPLYFPEDPPVDPAPEEPVQSDPPTNP